LMPSLSCKNLRKLPAAFRASGVFVLKGLTLLLLTVKIVV
jgi:hypothetical protein